MTGYRCCAANAAHQSAARHRARGGEASGHAGGRSVQRSHVVAKARDPANKADGTRDERSRRCGTGAGAGAMRVTGNPTAAQPASGRLDESSSLDSDGGWRGGEQAAPRRCASSRRGGDAPRRDVEVPRNGVGEALEERGDVAAEAGGEAGRCCRREGEVCGGAKAEVATPRCPSAGPRFAIDKQGRQGGRRQRRA